jgi:hypothetical protein
MAPFWNRDLRPMCGGSHVVFVSFPKRRMSWCRLSIVVIAANYIGSYRFSCEIDPATEACLGQALLSLKVRRYS